jgi:hypothetical protein
LDRSKKTQQEHIFEFEIVSQPTRQNSLIHQDRTFPNRLTPQQTYLRTGTPQLVQRISPSRVESSRVKHLEPTLSSRVESSIPNQHNTPGPDKRHAILHGPIRMDRWRRRRRRRRPNTRLMRSNPPIHPPNAPAPAPNTIFMFVGLARLGYYGDTEMYVAHPDFLGTT